MVLVSIPDLCPLSYFETTFFCYGCFNNIVNICFINTVMDINTRTISSAQSNSKILHTSIYRLRTITCFFGLLNTLTIDSTISCIDLLHWGILDVVLTLCMLGNFSKHFCCLLIFSKLFFEKKKSFRNTIRVSNSLDPDQARHIVGPDLYPNCLQR